MPANVETMFYVRKEPWHGQGTMVAEASTSADALVYASLNWSVAQKDVFTEDGTPISGYRANTRSTDNAVLGIVSDRYKVVQNDDAFRITDDLLGESVTYETSGALQGGRKVWMLARMPHRYIIAGDEVTASSTPCPTSPPMPFLSAGQKTMMKTCSSASLRARMLIVYITTLQYGGVHVEAESPAITLVTLEMLGFLWRKSKNCKQGKEPKH